MHAARVKNQYRELPDLELKLPKVTLLCNGIYENYSCLSLEEVQSAYCDQGEQVTLHPIVFYFRNEEGKLSHKSSVMVSDVLSHNALIVFAFLWESITDAAKKTCTRAVFIYYWTDSPTSQCRNESIFNISRHKDLFGIAVSSNYFE